MISMSTNEKSNQKNKCLSVSQVLLPEVLSSIMEPRRMLQIEGKSTPAT